MLRDSGMDSGVLLHRAIPVRNITGGDIIGQHLQKVLAGFEAPDPFDGLTPVTLLTRFMPPLR